MARDNWFKGSNTENDQNRKGYQRDGNKKSKSKDKKPPSTVMFIPNTKGGLLLKKMKDNEHKLADLTGFKISYTEAAGTKLARIFSQDLSRDQPCGRSSEKCSQCNTTSEKVQKCKARNITYESSCTMCNPPNTKENSSQQEDVTSPPTGREGVYIGETSRSLAERVGEHTYDAKSFSKKSHIVKHWMRSHPNLETAPHFNIKILRQYRDCLSRQVGEAIAILLSPDNLLNSKNEYIQNCISRVTVEEDKYSRRKRILEEEAGEKNSMRKM